MTSLKWILSATLAFGLIVLPGAVLVAQEAEIEPAPAAPKKAQDDGAAVEKWVVSLCERLSDANAVIRESAGSALVTVGKPALPHLKKLADMKDTDQSVIALRLIRRIEAGGTPADGRGQGQGAGPRDPAAQRQQMEERMKKVGEELGLNEDQMKKVTEAATAAGEQMRELMQKVRDGEMSREEMREQMQSLRDKQFESLKGTLSDDQISKLRESMGRGFGGGRRRDG